MNWQNLYDIRQKSQNTQTEPKRILRQHSKPIEMNTYLISAIASAWSGMTVMNLSTERPDVAAAQIYEGSVIILIDTSPQAMILPTSIFDFLQETNDF